MAGKQINPLFIQALTGRELGSISSSPTNKDLGGKYVKTMIDRKSSIQPIFQKNEIMLQCKHCSRKGKYNVGLVCINIPEKKEDIKNATQQMTGYFRCNHCNAAEWEVSSDLLMMSIATLIAPNEMSDRCQIGKNQLYDGTSHQYATDAEDHLLKKIAKTPNDGFLWNRLGNLYHKGGRPELAMAAFEKSISVDPNQMESHFSIGNLLAEVGDNRNAIYHLHQMMLTAEDYNKLDAEALRDLLSNGIGTAFMIFVDSNGKHPLLPPKEVLLAFGKEFNVDEGTFSLDYEIIPEDLTSFYPIAEIFMGKRVNEIPKEKRSNTSRSLQMNMEKLP